VPKIFSPSKEKFFERNQGVARRIIRQDLANNSSTSIIHGTRATNAQLPRFLARKTKDFDVFVNRPALRSQFLEMKLDKRFRGDFFDVKRGKGSPGVRVFKVISKIDGDSLVDFATPNRRVPTVSKRGKRFATLADQRKIARQNIKKKETRFRRSKDLDLLRRINKFEKLRGKRINGS
jgi:hypothetical protein